MQLVVLWIYLTIISSLVSCAQNIHDFKTDVSYNSYSIIKKNILQAINKGQELSKKINKIKILNNLLTQEIPISKFLVNLIYTYQNKHRLLSRYQHIQTCIPLLKQKNSHHSFTAKYQLKVNKKITLNIISCEHIFNHEPSLINIKQFTIKSGLKVFQPINYKCHIKLPITSQHKANIIYYSKDHIFGHSISNMFQYSFNDQMSLAIKYKTSTRTNKANNKKSYQQKCAKIIFKGGFKCFKFNISYGLLQNKKITPLIAHEMSIKISLKTI